MSRRYRPRIRFLYIFKCRTPYGFAYNGYGNSLDEMPVTCDGIWSVNLNKYGRS